MEKPREAQHTIDRRAAIEVRKVIMMTGTTRLSPPTKATSWRTSLSIQLGTGVVSCFAKVGYRFSYQEASSVRMISCSSEASAAARASADLGVSDNQIGPERGGPGGGDSTVASEGLRHSA